MFLGIGLAVSPADFSKMKQNYVITVNIDTGYKDLH
jgi:hypothetical protein